MSEGEIQFRNRYTVLDRLGSGGAGTVYTVQETAGGAAGGRRLALKALFSEPGRDVELVETMKQEFRVLATLRHPQLARVYDFGRIPSGSELPGSDGRPGFFFTRDLVDGKDLLSFGRGLSPARICRLVQHTARALDLLHRAGMVHGDLKPANVIVSPDGQPHLIDFGLVRWEGKDSTASGTAAYLAPESLRGEIVDRRVDLYALGITLYQLLAGQLPLPGASLHRVLNWHLEGPPLEVAPDPFMPEGLSPRVNAVLARLCHRERDRRFPSAVEAALALGELAELAGARPKLDTGEGEYVPPAPGDNLAGLVTELEQVVSERLLQGEPGPALVLVQGDPGCGKSTLITEVGWRCQLAGVETLRGEIQPADPRALGVWGDLLAQAAGVSGGSVPALEQARGEEGDRYGVFQQICDHLAEAARAAPLLILLDDAHDADEETRGLLRFLRHALPPDARVLILAAAGPDAGLAGDLGGGTTPLTISALGLQDVGRMVADASGRQDEELGRRIHAHTGGNPRFVQEVLRRLTEHGWPASPDLRSLAPPDSLEQMYRARWEALDLQAQEVLQVLAVLGRPAGGGVLLEVVLEAAGEGEAALVGLPLERLEQDEWLQQNADGLFQFSRGLVGRLVSGWTDQRRRASLHRAAAEVLDRQGEQDPVERARHAVGAGEVELAAGALPAALAQLRGLGSYRAGIQLCQDTIEVLPRDHAGLPALFAQLGRLQRAAGDLEPALATLDRACGLLQGDELIRCTVDLAAVHREAGRGERAVEVLRRALEREPPPRQRVACLAELAAAQMALDEHEAVVSTAGTVRDLLARHGDAARPADPAAVALLIGNLAWSLGFLHRYDEAGAALTEALEAARASGTPRAEASILNMMAVVAFRRGKYSEIEGLSLDALERARDARDVDRGATIRFNLGVFLLQRGEYAACLPHLEQSLRLFEAMGAHKSVATALCNHGYLQLKLGLIQQARDTLKRAVSQTREVGRRSGEALATLLLALVDARRGEADLARRGLADARAIYLEVGQVREGADSLLDLAEVELAEGKPGRADRAIQRAAAEVELEQVPDLHARVLVLRARVAALDPDAGQRQGELTSGLERAFELAEELGSPDLTWECHAATMELSDALGQVDRAEEHAARAADIQRRMAAGLPSEIQAAFWQDRRRHRIRERLTASHPAVDEREDAPPRRRAAPAEGTDMGLAETVVEGHQRLHPPAAAGSDPVAPGEQAPTSRRVEERFYRLLEIYRQINSELDPERLLGLVMDTAVELTGAERGFLLLGSGPDDIKIEVARNLVLEGEEGAYSRSIAERVMRKGQPVITVSARNDPRFKEYLSVHQLQLESVLCIPIHARDRVAGVLYMESRFQSGRFTPEDQRLLMAFGDQVAIALTNARLMQDNIRKAQELERANAEIEALAEERGRLLDQRTMQLAQVRKDLAETRRKLESKRGMFGMVGVSEPMAKLFHLVERVARTDVPVLVEGESGTGKEMVARAIHDSSPRGKRRLVSVNCAAIPEGLLESELFGHVRGAFTGADRERKGLFQAADGGSLFLDEIGDMPPRMQVDLLRALQEKTIRPVGAQRDLQVDVRVVAASNKSLAGLVKQGKFREDLYYRLNVVCLQLPPLRERADDILLLTDHFLDRIAAQMKTEKRRITRAASRRLMAYHWPGNVRQLEHTLMNAAVLADGDLLDAEDLNLEAPPSAAEAPPPALPEGEGIPSSSAQRGELEKQRILEALEACNWNKSKAARLLGIPRRTFYRRLTTHGIS